MVHDNPFTPETNASHPIWLKSDFTKIKVNTLERQRLTPRLFLIRRSVVAEPRRSAGVEMALNPIINPLLTSFR